MNLTEQLLLIVIEECDEISQRATKALRFGMTEKEPGQEDDNAQRLVYEFNDLVGVMELLHETKQIPMVYDKMSAMKKKEKVIKYLAYSEELGILKKELPTFILDKVEAVEFLDWVDENYISVYSKELNKSAWVDFKKHTVFVYGSDEHFTDLVNKAGVSSIQLLKIFVNRNNK